MQTAIRRIIMTRRREDVVLITVEVPPELKERLIYQARLNYRTATSELKLLLDRHLIHLPKMDRKGRKRKKD